MCLLERQHLKNQTFQSFLSQANPDSGFTIETINGLHLHYLASYEKGRREERRKRGKEEGGEMKEEKKRKRKGRKSHAVTSIKETDSGSGHSISLSTLK